MKNQRLYGVLLFAIGLFAMLLLPEDASAGFFVFLMSLCLLFGRKMEKTE